MTEIDHEKARELAEWMRDAEFATLNPIGVLDICRAYLDMVKLHEEEEARLNGMGASREAKLMAERDDLKTKLLISLDDAARWKGDAQHWENTLKKYIGRLQETENELSLALEKAIKRSVEIDALKATCEKYRAALEEIASACDHEQFDDPCDCSTIMMLIAERALASNAGEGKEE